MKLRYTFRLEKERLEREKDYLSFFVRKRKTMLLIPSLIVNNKKVDMDNYKRENKEWDRQHSFQQ